MTRGMHTGLLIAALLLTACGARAHEIGTTQVRFTLHKNHTWSAEITTAPTPLLNRLEAAAGQRLSGALDENVLRAKLGAFRQAVTRKIAVEFDGTASPVDVSLAWLGRPTDINQPLAVVLLAKGPVQAGARNVTWRYDLVYSTYVVVFSAEGARASETQ